MAAAAASTLTSLYRLTLIGVIAINARIIIRSFIKECANSDTETFFFSNA